MKTLVTGGAGFLGSHVTDELLHNGHQVTVLDDLSGGFLDNVAGAAEFVKGSITDSALVNTLFEQNHFDYVYHLAAYAAEGLSHFIKRFNYINNLVGSVNIINASVNTNVKCVVFTSSIAVYGTSDELPITEETPTRPEDSYGIAKLAVEQELRASKEMFDLDFIIFRPHNVYGERQNIGDRYRNVVGIFMNQLMQSKPMTIFGDGNQTRAFSYVGDVAPIIASAPELPEARNRVFNIGADVPYSVNDLANQVAEVMEARSTVVHLPERNEVTEAFASHKLLEHVFGYRSRYSLKEGLERMAKWARAHGARHSKEFEEIEVRKNLPKGW